MSKVVIEARNLSKSYADRDVVDQVSFHVEEGECFGILGPNGAGKSTLMKMICCGSPVSSGELFVMGLNVKSYMRKIKSQIGVLPQDDGLDGDFTVYDNLSLFASYHGLAKRAAKEKIIELLHFMRLEDYSRFLVSRLNAGMRRRLALARALINDPQILLLDEPTQGLDAQARYWIWEALGRMKQEGKTCVILTRSIEEAESLCSRVAIMHQSRLLMDGTPQQLIFDLVGRDVVEFAIPQTDVQYFIRRMDDQYGFQVLNNRIRLFIRDSQDYRKAIEMVESDSIVIRKATLGDVFLKSAGIELREQ